MNTRFFIRPLSTFSKDPNVEICLAAPLRLVILGKAVCVLQNTSHINHSLTFCIVFSDPPELSGLDEAGETLWVGDHGSHLHDFFHVNRRHSGTLSYSLQSTIHKLGSGPQVHSPSQGRKATATAQDIWHDPQTAEDSQTLSGTHEQSHLILPRQICMVASKVDSQKGHPWPLRAQLMPSVLAKALQGGACSHLMLVVLQYRFQPGEGTRGLCSYQMVEAGRRPIAAQARGSEFESLAIT